MSIFPKNKQRFQMSYKAKEVAMYYKLEESLMKELCIPTRSDLHKYCIRKVHNLRSAASLNIDWEMNMNNVKISDIYFHMLKEMARKNHQDINNCLNDLIAEKYTKKK